MADWCTLNTKPSAMNVGGIIHSFLGPWLNYENLVQLTIGPMVVATLEDIAFLFNFIFPMGIISSHQILNPKVFQNNVYNGTFKKKKTF